jgi:hypothetical protein
MQRRTISSSHALVMKKSDVREESFGEFGA